MITILFSSLFLVVAVGFLVFVGIKPGLRKLPDALRWLRAHGAENSWIEFRHTATGYSIRFEKRYIGGVPGFVFVNRNAFTSTQIENIDNHLRGHATIVVLKKVAANKRKGELWFGDDIQAATDFAQCVARDALSLSRFARFEFSFDIERHAARLLTR